MKADAQFIDRLFLKINLSRKKSVVPGFKPNHLLPPEFIVSRFYPMLRRSAKENIILLWMLTAQTSEYLATPHYPKGEDIWLKSSM